MGPMDMFNLASKSRPRKVKRMDTPKNAGIFEAGDTLPETNIAPENEPLEKEIPDLETIMFRCLC